MTLHQLQHHLTVQLGRAAIFPTGCMQRQVLHPSHPCTIPLPAYWGPKQPCKLTKLYRYNVLIFTMKMKWRLKNNTFLIQ